MLPLILFVLFFLVLIHMYSLKEGIDEKVIPLSFPRTDVFQLRSQVIQGKLDVQGPALLGIAGGGADVTYVEANQSQILFNSGGYDQSSDAALYADNGLAIKAGTVKVASDLYTGPMDATRASMTFLHVNRNAEDRYPDWQSGIHTWDLYANGTVGTGQDGKVTAKLENNGDIKAVVGVMNAINGKSLLCTINGTETNFLTEVDELRGRVNQLNQEINERNQRREEARRAAAARRNRRRGCTIS